MLAINSVWSVPDEEIVPKGLYRVLDIFKSVDSVILFPLNTKKNNKPRALSLSEFQVEIVNKNIIESTFEIPPYQQLSDDNLKSLYKEKRDIAYQTIKPLISDKGFLFNFSKNKRSKALSKYAKENSIDLDFLYRSLNAYWKYGQTVNGLIPAYQNSGGKGVSKELKRKRIGRPVKSRFGLIEDEAGKNITDIDKENIKKTFKKYCLRVNPLPVTKAYRKMLEQYYSLEIEKAEIHNEIPSVPSLTQYRYWSSILNPSHLIIEKQTNPTEFNLNNRQILGSSSGYDYFPGTRFEIDATSADVHIVSQLNRHECIGRPIFYAVTDVASRMIVGIHIGLEFASWKSARQALINAFTNKVSYCQNFGIAIKEAEWPCKHLPVSLLCDRGEMISQKAEKATVPMMALMIAPPYRADFKGIVERKFGTTNDDIFHELEGTTRGRPRRRGQIDPRLHAVYTLREITAMLILEIIAHNQRINKALAKETPLLIQHDISPTPLNYWNIHISESMHQLRKEDEITLRANLLPATTAYITPKGIQSNELYYTCREFEESKLFVLARSQKRTKVEARIDLDNSSNIYVRLNRHTKFYKCHLTSASSAYQNYPLEDILFLNEWTRSKIKKSPTNTVNIKNAYEIEKIKSESKELQKETPPLSSKNEKIVNIKTRRKEEIERLNSSDQKKEEVKKETREEPKNREKIDLFRNNRKRDKNNDDT